MSGALDNKETDHLQDEFGSKKKKNVYDLSTHRSDGTERSDTDWI